MLITAIANQKGGVGKTLTTLTLGALLADSGQRVLLIDLDPQSSLTQSAGINAPTNSLGDVIGGAEPGPLAMPAIIQTITPGLDLAPSDLTLAGCELGLVQRWGREQVLAGALAGLDGYDLVLIDCPPSLGLLTVAALTAAHNVIIPTLPAAADLRGLKLFLGTLDKIRQSGLNPGLNLTGVIITQYDNRLLAHKEALDVLEAAGLPVLLPPVPRSVKAQEAAGAKLPLPTYDPNGRVTAAYSDIATNLLARWTHG